MLTRQTFAFSFMALLLLTFSVRPGPCADLPRKLQGDRRERPCARDGFQIAQKREGRFPRSEGLLTNKVGLISFVVAGLVHAADVSRNVFRAW